MRQATIWPSLFIQKKISSPGSLGFHWGNSLHLDKERGSISCWRLDSLQAAVHIKGCSRGLGVPRGPGSLLTHPLAKQSLDAPEPLSPLGWHSFTSLRNCSGTRFVSVNCLYSNSTLVCRLKIDHLDPRERNQGKSKGPVVCENCGVN